MSLKKKDNYLNKNLHNKVRAAYMDNVEYVNGAKCPLTGELVIRKLNEEEKKFLNKFNKEYYGALFDKEDDSNLHKIKIEKKKLDEINSRIKELEDIIKASNEEKKKHREELKKLKASMKKADPKKELENSNNIRNRCILARGIAFNEILPFMEDKENFDDSDES